MLRSSKPQSFMLHSSESSQLVGGAPTWSETVWSYGVEAIDYWTIFSMKTKWNQNWKLYWNLGVFFMLLESLQRGRFNRVYFTIPRAKVWEILIFEWILLLEIQTNCKNWGWKEKSWALNMFTLGPMAQATLSVWNHQLPHRESNFSSLQKMVDELTLSMNKWWLIIVR
jgi:hypothetical protein